MSVMRHWVTTRHGELMHLLVQHPYYAVSNTSALFGLFLARE